MTKLWSPCTRRRRITYSSTPPNVPGAATTDFRLLTSNRRKPASQSAKIGIKSRIDISCPWLRSDCSSVNGVSVVPPVLTSDIKWNMSSRKCSGSSSTIWNQWLWKERIKMWLMIEAGRNMNGVEFAYLQFRITELCGPEIIKIILEAMLHGRRHLAEFTELWWKDDKKD